MKMDRLIGIVILLLKKEKTTAPELAERFEVSRRTISRDIEHLCKAGVPIITSQGFGGGIGIVQGYTLDKSLLTREELATIFAGLMGIDSVSRQGYSRQLSEKLLLADADENNCFLIDLASHQRDPLTQKMELLRQAIGQRHVVSFVYASRDGESVRSVEPHRLVFQWSAWYVLGYCQARSDFRLFKLNRLWDLRDTGQSFAPRAIPPERLEFDRYFSAAHIHLRALFCPQVKHRLIEEYGVESFLIQEDGFLLFERDFVEYDNMREWILSFGDSAIVIEPAALKEDILRQARSILTQYAQT